MGVADSYVKIAPEEIKSRIQIQDILLDQGVDFKKGRCRCPIHQGDNPLSFSFNDRTYYCHSCGAKGDLITLTQELYRLNFKDALKYLAQKAGLSENQSVAQKKPCFKPKTKSISAAELKLHIIEIQQQICAQKLRDLRRRLHRKEISFGDYLWETQKIDTVLEGLEGISIGLDELISFYSFQINQMRREKRRVK